MQCVVYDSTGQQFETTSEEALTYILDERAVLLEAHPEKTFRTVTKHFPVPIVIVLKHPVKRIKRRRRVQYNKDNLYLRDNRTCQYCGRHETKLGRREHLNRDHVFPKSRGGDNSWENLVTCCTTCNGRKSNRTPEEAGMKLLRQPYAPDTEEMEQLKRRSKK